MNSSVSRRQVIKGGILAAIAASAGAPATYANDWSPAPIAGDPWNGFKMGIASYTFRKMSLEDTIKAVQNLGLKYISIKDFHLALNSSVEERKAAVQKLKDGGITPLSCGNITMTNDEQNIRSAFEYARDCGLPTIVCSPDPASMPILNKMVKEFDIRLAIHNHGPEDKKFPSPYDIWTAVQPYDKRIGLCIDIGHTVRAKVNPAEAILKCRERLYDLHFKDIQSTAADAETIAAGRGVIDLASVWKALVKIKYAGLIGVEYESTPDNPYPEVAETIGYAKGLLKGLTT